jgi:hypothetical protein
MKQTEEQRRERGRLASERWRRAHGIMRRLISFPTWPRRLTTGAPEPDALTPAKGQ